MAQPSPIETLIEIAERETDDAAKRLGNAIRHQEEATGKLNLLLQYRDDYESKFQTSAAAGLNASQYGNFLAFLNKLNAAVDGQRKIIEDAERKVALAKQQWQSCEKKRLSYNTLDKRVKQQAQKKESKRDQKQTDEFAARAYFYKT
jgi:flagellar FliJ protein